MIVATWVLTNVMKFLDGDNFSYQNGREGMYKEVEELEGQIYLPLWWEDKNMTTIKSGDSGAKKKKKKEKYYIWCQPWHQI